MIFPDIFILDQFCWSKLLSMGNLLTAFSLFHCLKRGTDLQPCFVSNLGGFTEMLPETTVVHPGILAPLNEFKKKSTNSKPVGNPTAVGSTPTTISCLGLLGRTLDSMGRSYIYIYIYIYILYVIYWISKILDNGIYSMYIYIYSILDMQPGDYDL